MLVTGDQKGINLGIQQDCKCCTGEVDKMVTVPVVCGPSKTAASATIALMKSCGCDTCTELSSNGMAINPVKLCNM